MARIEAYTDTHRKTHAHYAEWELKLKEGTDVPDRQNNFLAWRNDALQKAGFAESATEIDQLLKDHKLTCCFQLNEAAQNVPLKDWDPKVKTYLIGPLNWLIKEVTTEVQVVTRATTAEQKASEAEQRATAAEHACASAQASGAAAPEQARAAKEHLVPSA